MAEWLRSGLQIRAPRFDSGSGLQTSPLLVKKQTRTALCYRWYLDRPLDSTVLLFFSLAPVERFPIAIGPITNDESERHILVPLQEGRDQSDAAAFDEGGMTHASTDHPNKPEVRTPDLSRPKWTNWMIVGGVMLFWAGFFLWLFK